MNRDDAFAGYARILNDTIDWLTEGYRQSCEEDVIIHPPRVLPHIPIPEKTLPPERVTPGLGNAEELAQIAHDVKKCTRCHLNLTRSNTCPGRGRVGASLMVVSPPPAHGALEDSSPLPNHENDYLSKWLIALQLDPERDVFITPAVKCRTPGGRPAQTDEVEACGDYLRNQYRAIAPKAVLALGDTACGALTGNSRDFPAFVGKEWAWGNIPALILWTPEEVLAYPNRLRRPVWQALQRFKVAWDALPESGL